MKLPLKCVMSRKSKESFAEIDGVEFLVKAQEKKVPRSKQGKKPQASTSPRSPLEPQMHCMLCILSNPFSQFSKQGISEEELKSF